MTTSPNSAPSLVLTLHDVLNACVSNNSSFVQVAVESGLADVDQFLTVEVRSLITGESERRRRTLPMISSQYGAVEVLSYLLSRGAEPNLQSPDDGWTATHCAFAGRAARMSDTLSLLVSHGANMDIGDHHGRRPMDFLQLVDSATATAAAAANTPVPALKAVPLTTPGPSDLEKPEYQTDDFRMHSFKIDECPRVEEVHDWTECPFVHPGEKARRRDPRTSSYSGVACPDFRKGVCKRGDGCPYAHGVFECWLHPSRYRTQMCKEGTSCNRKVCFFAHTLSELRTSANSLDAIFNVDGDTLAGLASEGAARFASDPGGFRSASWASDEDCDEAAARLETVPEDSGPASESGLAAAGGPRASASAGGPASRLVVSESGQKRRAAPPALGEDQLACCSGAASSAAPSPTSSGSAAGSGSPHSNALIDMPAAAPPAASLGLPAPRGSTSGYAGGGAPAPGPTIASGAASATMTIPTLVEASPRLMPSLAPPSPGLIEQSSDSARAAGSGGSAAHRIARGLMGPGAKPGHGGKLQGASDPGAERSGPGMLRSRREGPMMGGGGGGGGGLSRQSSDGAARAAAAGMDPHSQATARVLQAQLALLQAQQNAALAGVGGGMYGHPGAMDFRSAGPPPPPPPPPSASGPMPWYQNLAPPPPSYGGGMNQGHGHGGQGQVHKLGVLPAAAASLAAAARQEQLASLSGASHHGGGGGGAMYDMAALQHALRSSLEGGHGGGMGSGTGGYGGGMMGGGQFGMGGRYTHQHPSLALGLLSPAPLSSAPGAYPPPAARFLSSPGAYHMGGGGSGAHMGGQMDPRGGWIDQGMLMDSDRKTRAGQ